MILQTVAEENDFSPSQASAIHVGLFIIRHNFHHLGKYNLTEGRNGFDIYHLYAGASLHLGINLRSNGETIHMNT